MRKPLMLCAALAAVALCLPAHADKITNDPNAPGASQPAVEAPKDAVDERLAQKVTYTATGKRLHTVLEELSKKTNVSISAGKNNVDWQVRDLPVVVCVKDMPLGKLIRAIADATHLAMSTSTVENVKRYRLWRDPKRQKQLDDYFAQRDQAASRAVSAQWDAWLKISKMSLAELDAKIKENNSPVEDPTNPDLSRPRMSVDSSPAVMKSLAAVIAALPEGSKEDVMGGKSITLNVKTASPDLETKLKEYYKAAWEYARQNQDLTPASVDGGESFAPAPMGDLTDKIIESTTVRIGGEQNEIMAMMGESIGTAGLNISIEPTSPKGYMMAAGSPNGEAAYWLMSTPEDSPEIERPKTECAPGLHNVIAEDFTHPSLVKKFTIPKPKPDADITFGSVIASIAEASGFSIVCEDFQSQKSGFSADLLPIFDKDVMLSQLLFEVPGATLTGASEPGATPEAAPNESGGTKPVPEASYEYAQLMVSWRMAEDYLIDPDSKLIVGWASEWWERHRALAPDKLISDLVAKANSSGIEIDDAVKTVLLPAEQRREWVFEHKELFRWMIFPRYEPFWQMYASLSDEDRALAKSEAGLPLAKLDQNAVLAAFGRSFRAVESMGPMGKMEAIGMAMMSDPTLEQKTEQWAREKYPQMFEIDHSPSEEPDFDMTEIANSLMESFPEIKALIETPTDPSAILKLKMYLRKTGNIMAQAMMEATGTYDASVQDMHSYSLVFEGEGVKMSIGTMDMTFPHYSPKRQAKLMEEAEKSKASEKPEKEPAAKPE